MANVKISNLTAATTPVAGTEVLPIVQSGATVKVSIANLTAGRSVSATGLALAGSTSGTVTLAAKAVAGSTTFRLPAADGTSNQAMVTDGSGNLSFATIAATPGGSTTQVQYNNAGAFAGSANFTYASGTLSVLATTSSAFSGAADAGYSLFRGTTNSSGGVLSVSGNSTGNGINYVVFNSTLTGYEPANYGASQHIWKLGATEALRLNSSANLVLQGGTTTANGIGITFPATQSASTDANTLDDYEEGTWTPVIGGSGGTSGQTYSTQTGTYTKIGRQVTCNFVATLSAKGTITANLQIQGLPFTSGIGYSAICFAWWYLGASTTVVWLGGSTAASNTVATIYAATVATAASGNNLTTTDIGNSCQLQGTIIYTV